MATFSQHHVDGMDLALNPLQVSSQQQQQQHCYGVRLRAEGAGRARGGYMLGSVGRGSIIMSGITAVQT